MEKNEGGQKKILTNWRNIIWITLVLFILTAIFTFVQPLKYRASARFLIVQNYSEVVDASKATEHLGDILSQVIYSSSFFNEVTHSGFNIDESRFSLNEQKRKKQWEKTVDASAISDTGILAVNVFHKNREQADQLAQAISYVLKTKHSLYHGGGDKVSVMMIDKPITTNWPVKPNVAVNLILALVFGIVIGVAFVYYFPDYQIKEIFKRKQKRIKDKISVTDGNPARNENLDLGIDDHTFTKEEELYDRFEE